VTIYVYRNGKVVEAHAAAREVAMPVPGQGDERGVSFQLPRNYLHANTFTEHGYPYWLSKREAQEIAQRARGEGDERLYWDK